MYDLTGFSLSDMSECCSALRKLGVGATGMGEVAERIVRFLHTSFVDTHTHEKNCCLVRFFKTDAYADLDDDCQRFARDAMGRAPHSPHMKCLTLMSTAGEQSEWNDKHRSRRYRAIPLASEQFIAQFPMFSQLLKQFGVPLRTSLETGPDLLMDWEAKTYNVFYVPDALGSPFVPVQDTFVVPLGIRTVLGFGGILPSRNLFAVILFSKVHIPRETADLFKTLALAARLAILPFDAKADVKTTGLGAKRMVVSGGVSKMKTLEQLLTVHERAVTSHLIDPRSAEELRKSEYQFRSLVENARDVILTVSTDGRIRSLNPVFETLTGWPRAEWIGQPFGALLHPDDRQVVSEIVRHIVEKEDSLTCCFRIRSKGHGYITSEFMGTPQVKGGQVTGVLGIARDITERKIMEDALRDSEEQMRSIVQSTTDAILSIDSRGRISFWNKGAEAMFGYASDEAVGLPMTDMIAECRLEVLQQGLARATAGSFFTTGQVFELIGLRKDRTEFPLEVNLGPWKTKSGQECFTVAARDITDRKRAEESLRKSAERFHRQQSAMVRLTHSRAVQSSNLPMRLRRITEAAAQALGVERVGVWRYTSDRQAMQCVDLYELNRNRHSSGYEIRTASYPSYFEALTINQVIAADNAHHDPRTREFSASHLSVLGISSMMDVPIYQFGKLEGVMSTGHIGPMRHWTQDEQMCAVAISNLISLAYEQWEREQTEEALRKNEEFSLRMTSSSQDCITVLDLQGRLLWMNECGQRLLGLDEFERVRNRPWIDFWQGTDRDEARGAVASAEAGGVGTFHGYCPTVSGDPKWWDVIITPMLDVEGRPDRLLSVSRDITERKEAQEEVQRTLNRVRTLSRRLEAIREDERARIARELHDQLGTGLTCLKIDLTRLLTIKGEAGDRKGRRRADTEIRSMVEFVDATICSIQRIVSELRPAILDDLGLVAAIEWQAQDFESRTGITCTCSFGQEDLTVEAERATVIFRICQEALTNVARHAAATAVDVCLGEQHGVLTLDVCDNGRGISEEKLSDPRSFGLLGMQERAVLLDGKVIVRSRPGEGTTVTLRLPHQPIVRE